VLRENDLISIPKEIGELVRLRELHIQGNRLTVLPPEIGKYCSFKTKIADTYLIL
jgi:Leucine-rich repeat (LRR) protein